MIESVINTPVALSSNSSVVTFTTDDLRTRSANCCGWLQHSEGSPLYKILKGGIYEIDLDVLVSLGVKNILIDLDNTIVPYIQKEPSEKAKEFKTNLDKIGISLLICSNNKGKRVSHFANLLGVSYFHSLRKPFASRLLKALKQSNINKNECIPAHYRAET